MADRKHIQIEHDLNLVSACSEADAPRMEQVFENLLSNAVKFGLEGFLLFSSISPPQEGSGVQFTVSDSGRISANDLPHIFERFYRGKPQEVGPM
ncbi:MAG: HAMP domain-containing sensor histidine kinase [Nitrospirales bacterium]|nr:HAMP domain-containing histidine kinase [Nitrospirales bacterium]